LVGDPSKAEKLLGWKAKTKFEELVKLMMKSDLGKVLTRGY
jgi:GDPmannose 4,6-dehydratase